MFGIIIVIAVVGMAVYYFVFRRGRSGGGVAGTELGGALAVDEVQGGDELELTESYTDRPPQPQPPVSASSTITSGSVASSKASSSSSAAVSSAVSGLQEYDDEGEESVDRTTEIL